jgi:carbonic anhydrase
MDQESRLSSVDDLLLASERHAAAHIVGGGIETLLGVAILTCMDARIDPVSIFGLEPGDAHVLRNAGGRASADALRSFAVSNNMGGTREIVVMHHTDCALLAEDEVLRRRISDISGADASSLDLLSIKDLDRSVREDVARVLGSAFTPDDVRVWGLIYDVATGRVRQVFPG